MDDQVISVKINEPYNDWPCNGSLNIYLTAVRGFSYNL